MIISDNSVDVTLSNVGNTGEFKIKNSRKAFQILSSGLYSNKIKAIIRELSTNALDSHRAAGTVDTPFEVHLPTILEPYFSVRDYGTGLTDQEIESIYTTYFESTKTNSNEYIGALGLGSKSPFSYTDNFTVTSVKNGSKSIYSAYINNDGIPSVASMGRFDTTEKNGIEVKFGVAVESDFNKFADEGRQVFSYFTNKPTITGNTIKIPEQVYLEKDFAPGIHLKEYSYYGNSTSIAVMGNIAYRLSNIPAIEQNFGELAVYLDTNNCVFECHFDVGELDISASRESLSYIPLTIDSIRKKLQLLHNHVTSNLENKLNDIPDTWGKILELKKMKATKIYRPAIAKYITSHSTVFKNINEHTLQILISNISSELSVCVLSNKKLKYIQRHGVKSNECLPVNSTPLVVIDDITTSGSHKIVGTYFRSDIVKYNNGVFLSGDKKDMPKLELLYQELLSEMNNPPMIRVSDLKKSLIEESKVAQSHTIHKRITGGFLKYSPRDQIWRIIKDYQVDITDTNIIYYMPLDNITSINTNGKVYDFDILKNYCDAGGSLPNIIGVRKSVIDQITGLSNWVHIETLIEGNIKSITIKDIIAWATCNNRSIIENRLYNSTRSGEISNGIVDKNSKFLKIKEYRNVQYTSNWVMNRITKLLKYFKIDINVDNIIKDINNDELFQEYPMLLYITDYYYTSDMVAAIIDYINLIDSSKKYSHDR